MNDPVFIYSRARAIWHAFHSSTCDGHHAERLRRFQKISAAKLADTLRLLPAGEREPVAFGVYLGAASGWNSAERERFRRNLLSGCHPAAAEVLDGADHGRVVPPARVPATLEEFPSRIWKRAMASGRQGRLVTAGLQSVEAIVRLLESYPGHRPGTSAIVRMPRREHPAVPIREAIPDYPRPNALLPPGIGDMPFELDLIAVAPASGLELKARMFHHFTTLAESGVVRVMKPTLATMMAWVRGATQNVMPEAFFADREMRLADSRKCRTPFCCPDALVTMAGSIAYRFGRRRLAARFDPMPGPGLRRRHGWHHLPIPPDRHARLHRFLAAQNGADATGWQVDPGLACSGMSLPLWLADGGDHLPKIAALLERTSGFPWAFPRLHHVFQWHLALAGHLDALREIGGRFPGDSWGFETPPPEGLRETFRRLHSPQQESGESAGSATSPI